MCLFQMQNMHTNISYTRNYMSLVPDLLFSCEACNPFRGVCGYINL